MVAPDVTAIDSVELAPDELSISEGDPSAPDGRPTLKTGFRGRPRRTWPQRLLLLAGLGVAAACFATAFVFWQANVVLSEIPRIQVGPDVLAAAGDPGAPINMLLVGVDSSEGLDPDDPVRVGRETEDEARGVVRPDTILIVRLDPATGTGAVLSLPRDLIVELDGGSTTRLNATQTIGGIGSLIEAIDENLGIPVNHFAQVDFAGFSEVVDLVGGVPVNFPFPTRDSGSGLAVPEAGCYNLNGSQSLSYVRARSIEEFIEGEWIALGVASPDLARIERQQEFLVLTTEQVLAVARRDVSRINSFIGAGTQAVQLDEELTPGDIAELASAFSDFDTGALEVSTLPVAATFSDDGQYLGEQLQLDASLELLRFFRGESDVVRPDDVSFTIQTDTERHATELGERGFDVETIDGDLVARSTVRFDPDTSIEEALLLSRYLETAPVFVAEDEVELSLEVGPDFAGVRLFPRAASDVAEALATAVDINNGLEPSIETPPEALPSITDEVDETSVPGFASGDTEPLLSNAEANTDQTTVVPQLVPSPLDTAVRGRPPEGVGCTALGG